MEYDLFTRIAQEFYRYNGIPVFIVKDGGIVFKTIDDDLIGEHAEAFLKRFEEGTDIVIYGEIECYASFPFRAGGEEMKVVVGPAFTAHPINIGYRGRFAAEEIFRRDRFKDFIISVAVTGEENFKDYISVISQMTGNGKLEYDVIKRRNISLKKAIDKDLTEYVFEARENQLSPYAPETERRILEMVKDGEVEELKKISTALTADAPGQRIQYAYKVVSLVTLCTRAVLERGVDATVAYGLSDRYLDKLGRAKNDGQVADIAKNVLPHFASLVSGGKEKGSRIYSPHIVKAEKYIRSHLHYRITLKDAAEAVGVSEKYLSRLFITHRGEKFSSYVNRQRVNEAKELILNTDRSLSYISYSIGFSSESYFIKIFRKLCGMTPQVYRSKYQNNK